MGQAAIPIVLALASTAATTYNTNQTAKKRDADVARGIRENSKKQEQADQKINQNLDEMEGSRSIDFRDELQASFLDTIAKKRLQAQAGLDTAGGTSSAYKDAAGGAKVASSAYGGKIANLLAGIDAAGNQRQSENSGKIDLGMDLNKFGRDAEQNSFLAQLRAARHRDNPWISMGAAGLSGAAAGYGGGGSGTKTFSDGSSLGSAI